MHYIWIEQLAKFGLKQETETMDIVGAKVLVMVLTSVIPILLSLLPLWFKGYLIPDKSSSPWRAVITSMLLCFGGGVLLATSLVHLLPEVGDGNFSILSKDHFNYLS